MYVYVYITFVLELILLISQSCFTKYIYIFFSWKLAKFHPKANYWLIIYYSSHFARKHVSVCLYYRCIPKNNLF